MQAVGRVQCIVTLSSACFSETPSLPTFRNLRSVLFFLCFSFFVFWFHFKCWFIYLLILPINGWLGIKIQLSIYFLISQVFYLLDWVDKFWAFQVLYMSLFESFLVFLDLWASYPPGACFCNATVPIFCWPNTILIPIVHSTCTLISCLFSHCKYVWISNESWFLFKAYTTVRFDFFSVSPYHQILASSSHVAVHVMKTPSSVLLYIHRDCMDCLGWGAQDGHLDFHTSPELR